MKSAIIFILILVSLFGLCSCSSQYDDVVGIYTCARLELNGEEYHVLDIYPEGCSLQLSKWGQAWLNMENDSFYGRWTLEGENFSLDINGVKSVGNLSDGVCRLKFSDSEMEHSFLKEGANLPDKLPVVKSSLTSQQLFWNGDWYGYWTLENAKGIWADQNGQRFDCFARIEIDENSDGKMIFWDEFQDSAHPIAQLELSIKHGKDEESAGTASNTGGYFLDTELEKGLWSVDPASYIHDSVFYLEKVHYEGKEGGFDYSIVMRPWGRTWEDIEAAEPDMLPYFYYDWYLPVLSSGASMPDSFEYTSDTVIRNTWTEPEKDVNG